MKTNNILTVALFVAMSSACTENKELSSGLNLANLDSTYQAGTDFYMFATGGWQKANPLTAEYSRFGSFDVLRENNIKQLQGIIDSVSAQKNLQPGSIEQKIAGLYNSAMDSVELNENSGFALEGFLQCDIIPVGAIHVARQIPDCDKAAGHGIKRNRQQRRVTEYVGRQPNKAISLPPKM